MFYNKKKFLLTILSCVHTCITLCATEQLTIALARLKNAYPDYIQAIEENHIIWKDGTHMPLYQTQYVSKTIDRLDNPSLADQLTQAPYKTGKPTDNPQDDPGRIRYEPFFCKMYGNSPDAVESNLQTIVWMPNIFGEQAPTLRVTKINNIAQKIQLISQELEELVLQNPTYRNFVDQPGGTYNWRTIAHTTRLSNHSLV